MSKRSCTILFVIFLLCSSAFSQPPRFVSTKGTHRVAPDGKPILLRGINLGNWLVPEGYMIKFRNTNSPRLINSTFTELLGPAETKIFWEKYRDNFITKEDIAFIKKAGLNSIRVPFNYRLFVSEDQLLKFDGPGMEMLDRVVKWCKEEHLFVILDMHCAPGGQTGDNIDDVKRAWVVTKGSMRFWLGLRRETWRRSGRKHYNSAFSIFEIISPRS